ncbi:MAG: DUF364 domain-containing protein [Deltaproteobacteria bacterium]|nr:DUF364 domain-containing protein [Deltaproteobacteria bacterium]
MKQLLKTVSDTEKQLRIDQVVLGLGYIAVELEDSRVGLSANIADTSMSGCSVFSRAGSLKGSSVAEILDLGVQDNLLSRAIALAAVNAVSNTAGLAPGVDVFERMAVQSGEHVAMVGFIAPVAQMLKKAGAEVSVFEKRTLESAVIRPETEMALAFAEADIIILSATTIINNTIYELLTLPNTARDVILMGPSTPMIPDVFISTPVTYLAGSAVTDGRKALQIVMEGGGTQVLYRADAMKKIHQEVHQ